jgi:hypothetical protein
MLLVNNDERRQWYDTDDNWSPAPCRSALRLTCSNKTPKADHNSMERGQANTVFAAAAMHIVAAPVAGALLKEV